MICLTASLIFFGKNTCNKLESRRETMARPVTRKPHNNCLECGADMKEVTYIRPYAKVCSDCKSLVWSGNTEIKKVTQDLQKRNSKMTREELGLDEMFEDDPRAVNEKEYGKVYHKETIIADRVNVLDTID